MVDGDSVLAVNQAFYDAIESGDLDLMRSIWAARSDVVCTHPGAEPIKGREQVLRSWAMIMANTDYIQFFLTDVDLSIAPGAGEPTIAVVTCVENMLAGAASEDTFNGGKAVATNLFVRSGSGWKMWMHHGSPVAVMEER